MLLFFSPHLQPQTDENKLIKSRFGIHSGVCIHNGIVRKNRDEWTVDDCTECTCQVRSLVCSCQCVLCLKHKCEREGGELQALTCLYMYTHMYIKVTQAAASDPSADRAVISSVAA